jgi:hypothetical protein
MMTATTVQVIAALLEFAFIIFKTLTSPKLVPQ